MPDINGTRLLILALTGFAAIPSVTMLWTSTGNAPPFEPPVMFALALVGGASTAMLAVLRSWTDAAKPPEDKLTSTPQVVLDKPPN